jgi:hypothetical protein
MFRMIFICLCLFPSSLFADTSLEGALDALLKAPWTESPSSLPDSASWKIEPYTTLNTFELQGYDLRAFFRDEGPIRTKIFTFAEPSLTSSREMILMGYIQETVQSEEEAGKIHQDMLACLETRGFESVPPDTTRDAVMHRMMYKGSEVFRKGDMGGLVYHIQDYRTQVWYVRTSISHPLFQEFLKRDLGEWPKWWEEEYIIPDKLRGDLERNKMSIHISKSFMAMFRPAQDSIASYKREVNQSLVKGIIKIYEKIDGESFSNAELPAVLMIKNYLARFLFYNGFWKEIIPEQSKWLLTHGIGYTWSELGGSFIYNESVLKDLSIRYPDTYWGQFAFLNLLEMGFDTSGICRNGSDQWSTVLESGLDFLAKHPDSVIAPDIRFYLGKAAETLYNLGIMDDHPERETSGLNKGQFADRSEDARTQAIHYYEEVLQSPQKGKYEDHLKYILPRVRAGFATGCTYYFCFYD